LASRQGEVLVRLGIVSARFGRRMPMLPQPVFSSSSSSSVPSFRSIMSVKHPAIARVRAGTSYSVPRQFSTKQVHKQN
jgi:hypothetical protein